MAVAYDIIEDEIQVITVYPTSRTEIDNRLKRGRWIIHPSKGGKDEKS